MVTAFMSEDLRAQILAINPALQIELKNVRVNGAAFGCTGFITNHATGKIAYVSTDHNHGTNHKALYRTAKHTKDYTGGVNRQSEYDDLAQNVVAMVS